MGHCAAAFRGTAGAGGVAAARAIALPIRRWSRREAAPAAPASLRSPAPQSDRSAPAWLAATAKFGMC